MIIPNFRGRFDLLCESIGINEDKESLKCRKVARKMLELGINKPQNYDATPYEKYVDNMKKQIQKDYQGNDPTLISCRRLDWYCRLFKCSADYLMGYSDTPIYELKNLQELTGLSNTACKTLLEKQSQIKLALNHLLPDFDADPDSYYFKKETYVDGCLDLGLAVNAPLMGNKKSFNEYMKMCLLNDITTYLNANDFREYVMDINTEEPIDVFGCDKVIVHDDGTVTKITSDKAFAVLMLSIQEKLQRIRDLNMELQHEKQEQLVLAIK